MNDHPDDHGQEPPQQRRAAPGQRRPLPKGLVFDDPLDRQSSDDTDTGWGETSAGSSGGRDLQWYLNERPPHHGG